ncbi:SNF2-related protein [Rhodococcus ruber]|uniref:SNF2-related protein n=1 Tax=Rhodococcus ruber TaxID=1830 RepID=UPI000C7A5E3A|nr:SNF2-related protein [Rhodococcus ruber]AUM20301.1 hypothetical protein CSW53_27465 [Rhodococcus ruber]
MLRRTKTEVAPELPPREVIDVACTITAEQRRLYERALTEAFDTGLGSGAARRTTVLALLTRLKQICNHPPRARRTGRCPNARQFDRLGDMLDEVIHTAPAA